MKMLETRNWIGGEWITPQAGEITAVNPSDTQEVVGVVRLSENRDVLRADEAAREAFARWSRFTGAQRGEILYQMAKELERAKDELAELASREMGKPIAEMKGEVARGVNLLKYYAAEGVRADGGVIPSSESGVLQYTKRVPLGTVGIITPWNFPVAIPIWKLAPALICGNTVVWKPAEWSSLTACRLAEIFSRTDLPPGVLNLVIGKGSRVGEALLRESAVNVVSFTGSSETGARVAEICARRNIKYQTEMGGKNAAVVLRDADLSKAVPAILSGAFRSAGQKCTATSRIIVERSVMSDFCAALKQGLKRVRVAHALDPAAFLGPVASSVQYETVMNYVETARKEADIVAEGEGADGEEGYYIAPLVAAGVGADHPLAQDEIFGPVAVILPAEDVSHAIELCNRTVYGLSASVFTEHLSWAFRFLEEAQAGMVRVNLETAGVEYQAPFGGMKRSGSHSREQGQAALEFYSEIKTVAIRYGG
jgi:aldehyde dehydrogenase (NAD+)